MTWLPPKGERFRLVYWAFALYYAAMIKLGRWPTFNAVWFGWFLHEAITYGRADKWRILAMGAIEAAKESNHITKHALRILPTTEAWRN